MSVSAVSAQSSIAFLSKPVPPADGNRSWSCRYARFSPNSCETGASRGAEDKPHFPCGSCTFDNLCREVVCHSWQESTALEGSTAAWRYARHYYDCLALGKRSACHAPSEEYSAIKTDYDRISQEHFAKRYFPPSGMSFAESEALFPSADLGRVISKEYEEQCQLLCYAAHPSWEAVQARFRELKELL